ncbi:MAG: T9SS type A sorting domain-containing protein, partial [Candidatus Latescibacteria bacterium]|nr:T9SS type A sorting domain-containing protein [Candidatus Latescibacterota bacterium]
MKILRMFVFVLCISMQLATAYAEGTLVVFPTPDEKLYKMALQNNTTIWFGGYSIWRFDFESETWTEFNQNNELYDTIVTDICTASDGTVWFSTQEEVLKFDGTSWTKLTYEDGLPHYWEAEDDLRCSVWSVAEAPDGSMWFAGDGGISVYDGSTWSRFTMDDGLPEISVFSLAFGHDGSVWCGSCYGGTGRYLNGTWDIFIVKYGNTTFNYLRGIKCAPDGTMWFGSSNGVCSYKDGIWNTYTTKDGLLYKQTKEFAFDENGTVWIATNKGISLFDGEHWSAITTDDGLSSNSIVGIIEGRGNEKWIRAGYDINIYNPDVAPLIIYSPNDLAYLKNGTEAEFLWETWPNAETFEIEFADNYFFENAERLTITGTSFTQILNEEYGYDAPGYWRVRALSEDGQSYWTSPRRYFTVIPGPELITPADMEFVKAGTEYTFTWEEVPNASEYEIHFSDSENFANAEQFSTTTTSLIHMTNENFRRESPAYWRVRAIIDGNTGDWSASGSYYTQEAWVQYTIYDGLINNVVNCIVEDNFGAVWIGAVGGLSCLKNGTWQNYTSENGLIYNHVGALSIAEDSSVWIGTLGGISHFDGKNFTNYTISNGLIDGNIYGIKVAEDGTVWATTKKGVSWFDGLEWKHYIFNEESIDLSYLVNTEQHIAFSPNGDLWIGSRKYGIIMFDGQNWYDTGFSREITNQPISGLAIAKNGKVWVSYGFPGSSRESGVACYDGSGWKIEKTQPNNRYITALTLGPDDSVWISAYNYGGIYKYGGETWALIDEKKVGWTNVLTFGPNGLMFAAAGTFTPAMSYTPYKDGLWIYDGYAGTPHSEPPDETIRGNFTQKITPEIRTGNLVEAKGTTSEALEGIWTTFTIGNIINITHEDHYIWCSTKGGVIRFDTRDNTYISIGGTYGNIAVTPDKKVWISRGVTYCWDGIVWSGDLTNAGDFDGGTFANLVASTSLINFGGIFAGNDNSLYMAIKRQMWMYKDGTWELYVKLSGYEAFALDHNDTVWQQTNSGMMSYSNGTWTTYELDWGESAFVRAIEVSLDNNIWVNIFDGGAFSYDGVTWTEYSPEEKTLAHYNVMAHNGVFWMGDSEGLHRLELKSSSDVDEDNDVPVEFMLSQNSPNPFNPYTSIEYSLPKNSYARLEIYNSQGQLVDVLVDGYRTAGSHMATWNTGNHSSGMYFYRFRSGDFTSAKKMLLV